MPVIQGSVTDVIVSAFQRQVSFLPQGGVLGQVVESQGAAAPIFADPGAMLSPSAGSVILAPTTSARNVIQPTSDTAIGLTIASHSATVSVPGFVMQQANGNVLVQFQERDGSGFSNYSFFGAPASTRTTYNFFGTSPISELSPNRLNIRIGTDAGGNQANGVGINAAGWLVFQQPTTPLGTGNFEDCCAIFPSMASNVDASFKGGFNIVVFDSSHDVPATNGLTVISGASNGTVPLFGVLGAPAVVQQANASLAGVSGIAAGAAYAQADMVAVKNALTAIRAGLAANGVLANTA